jgi:hypothetical protein
MLIGRAVGLCAEAIQGLGVAAMFHDVGYAARGGGIPPKAKTLATPASPRPSSVAAPPAFAFSCACAAFMAPRSAGPWPRCSTTAITTTPAVGLASSPASCASPRTTTAHLRRACTAQGAPRVWTIDAATGAGAWSPSNLAGDSWSAERTTTSRSRAPLRGPRGIGQHARGAGAGSLAFSQIQPRSRLLKGCRPVPTPRTRRWPPCGPPK